MLKQLLKHFAALIYDLFILAALAMAWTGGCLLINQGHPIAAGTRWYQLSLLLLIAGYYGLSWRYGRQTIGMRAWRLRWA